MPDPKERFAVLIREGRERLGLKQEELAERLGVRQPTVSGWETGRTLPSLPLALKAAELLDLSSVELVEILTGAGAGKPEETVEAVG